MDEGEKAVVVLISSDDEDEASQPEEKKRKCMVDDKAAAERSGLSGGVHVVVTREEENRVLSNMTDLEPYAKMIAEVEIVKRSRRKKWKNKRNKKKNKINCSPQDKIDVYAANDEERADKFEDIKTAKAIEVDVVKEGEHPDKVKAVGTEGKQVDAGKSIKKLKLYGTKSVEESNNIVLQKLLRGPRYFDLHEKKQGDVLPLW